MGGRGTRTSAAPSRMVGSLNASVCPLLQKLSAPPTNRWEVLYDVSEMEFRNKRSLDRQERAEREFVQPFPKHAKCPLNKTKCFTTSASAFEKVTPLLFCEVFWGCFLCVLQQNSSLQQLVKAEKRRRVAETTQRNLTGLYCRRRVLISSQE